MNINLHIERLVLDGITLSPGESPLLKAAVEAELTRLLMSGGVRSACFAPLEPVAISYFDCF